MAAGLGLIKLSHELTFTLIYAIVMVLETFCHGTRLLVLFTPDAVTTLKEAEGRIPPQKRAACMAQLFRVFQRLSHGQQVRNKARFRNEGQGIFAAKARCGLRGYGWFQTLPSGEGAFIVSHFILKKKQKAEPKEVTRTVAARKSVE